MADTISIDDVRYVAGLAKIAVSDDEATRLQKELDAILGYVQQLDQLDTTGVEPTYQVTGLKNVDRDDVIIDYGVSQEALLRLAPQSKDGQIKVPKVL
jgi:aspartyl-tRNA(Asn)/glutamyl-tRNA(Gln) amidotransferase subunit C